MATLYVWLGSCKDKTLGHASLYIHQSNEYISWWPTCNTETGEEGTTLQACPKNYKEDRDNYMKRPANHTFEVKEYCFDISKMSYKWQSIINNQNYLKLSKNSSNVVMDVLSCGAMCCVIDPKQGKRCFFTPRDVQNYGLKLRSLTLRRKCCFFDDMIVSCVHRCLNHCNCGVLFVEGLFEDLLFCFLTCMFVMICCFPCICIYSCCERVSCCCQCDGSMKYEKYEEIHDV